MNRPQLNRRIRQLESVIRGARSFIGVQTADKETQANDIATLNTEIETLNQIIADLQTAAAALTSERNSARMMYCEYDNSVYPKEWFAEQEGWLDLYGPPPA